MACSKSDGGIVSFEEAIAVSPINSHKYLSELPLDYCYGSSKSQRHFWQTEVSQIRFGESFCLRDQY